MKKFWLFVILASFLSFTYSCTKETPNNENQQETPTPSPEPTPTPTPTPEPTPQPVSVKLEVTGTSPLEFVELTEAGKYLICEVNSEKEHVYSTGDYTISDGKYVLGNDATLTFGQTGSPVSFTLKKNDGKEISGTATPVKNTSSSSNLKKLCKTWVITKTRVSITEGAKANADFTGCNLEEIADFTRKQGVEIKHDFTGVSVSTITVMPTGTTIITYSTGKFDVVKCDLSGIDKGTVKYSWPDGSAMGYEFTNGSADVAFQEDYCILSAGSDFVKDSKKYVVAVTFVLAEKK